MFEIATRGGGKRRTWRRGDTLAASLVVHLLLAAVVARLPATPPAPEPVVEETVTFLNVLESMPPMPELERETSEAEAERVVAASAPPARARSAGASSAESAESADGGVEEVLKLVASEVPMEIPTPAPALAGPSGPALAGLEGRGDLPVSGLIDGAALARLRAERGGREVVPAAALAEFPEVVNRRQMASIWRRLYPNKLNDAGVEGQSIVSVVINRDGRVDPATIVVLSSTHPDFAEAAIKGATKLRFRPARLDGRPVRVRANIPVTWKLEA